MIKCVDKEKRDFMVPSLDAQMDLGFIIWDQDIGGRGSLYRIEVG